MSEEFIKIGNPPVVSGLRPVERGEMTETEKAGYAALDEGALRATERDALPRAYACGCRLINQTPEVDVWLNCGRHVGKGRPPRPRYYVRAAVVEAERLESGNWRVTGRGWLARGVEFTDEDFRRNFEAL
jgi:hypothetical protein